MPDYLFSYGTLQQEKTQHQLFGRQLTGAFDQLPGYIIQEIIITDELFLSRGEDAFQHIATPSTNAGDMVIGIALE